MLTSLVEGTPTSSLNHSLNSVSSQSNIKYLLSRCWICKRKICVLLLYMVPKYTCFNTYSRNLSNQLGWYRLLLTLEFCIWLGALYLGILTSILHHIIVGLESFCKSSSQSWNSWYFLPGNVFSQKRFPSFVSALWTGTLSGSWTSSWRYTLCWSRVYYSSRQLQKYQYHF